MNKKSVFVLIIPVLIIFILIILIVGFYWWRQISVPPTSPEKETSLEIPEDWKTYRKEKCNFEFKYPPNFSVDVLDYSNPYELAEKGIPYNPNEDIICAGFIDNSSITFYISVVKTEYEDIETWFRDYRLNLEKPYVYEGLEWSSPQIILVDDITIDNIKGKKTITSGLPFYNGGRINTIKNGYLYDFAAFKTGEEFSQEEIELTNQILFSFRFLE